MLERVSPSAECAAHIFLRRFEAPVRSQRSLNPSFWRHGNEHIDVPTWWPLYLDNIRNRSSTPRHGLNLKATTSSTPTGPHRHSTRRTNCPRRPFSNSPQYNQTAPAQVVAEDRIEEVENNNLVTPGAKAETVRAVRKREDLKNGNSRTRAISTQKAKSHFQETWKDFMRHDGRGRRASPVMHLLASSDSNDDLSNALKAFESIPKSQRTAEDYCTAVDTSIRLDRYSTAIQAIKEAVSNHLSHETFFKLLALCVSRGLWNTAADLWRQVSRSSADSLHNATQDDNSKRQNVAGKYTALFDIVSDLPSKLVSLASRLEARDPILMAQADDLYDLHQKLLLLAVESDKVMGMITSQGVLSLFSLHRQSHNDTQLHFAALATIGRSPAKGTKSELAMIIYRNFKFMYPKSFTPKWVFGMLIGICSAGNQGPSVYRSILQDYKAAYRVPEDSMYRLVLKACAAQGEVDDVQEVFDDFCKHSKPKNADDINPLIRVHAVTGNCDKAQLQFDKVRKQFGFEPNTRSWNFLLLAYSRSDRNEKAYAKFEEMKEKRIQPDEYTWSIMVAIAAKRGDTKLARSWVRRAKDAGTMPPLAMTGAVVDSCLLNGNLEEAWELVLEATRTAQARNESPIRLWNSIFRYLAFKSDSDGILQTQTRMKELNVKADGMTYAALMTALVFQRRTKDAAQILRNLHFSQALSANEFHYSILIHGFAMEGKYEPAMVIYNELLQRFPRATLSAKLSMLHLQAMRDEERARSKYLSGKTPLKPDFQPTLQSAKDILMDIKSSDLASSMPNPGFGRNSSRVDVDKAYLSSLVSFLLRNGAHESAQEVLQALKGDTNELKSEITVEAQSWKRSLKTSAQELEVAVHSEDWSNVSKTWGRILDLVLTHCTPTDTATHALLRPRSAHTGTSGIEITGGMNSQFSSMISQPIFERTLQGHGVQVLPAYQYVLSRPLSQYLKALNKQQKYTEMFDAVKLVDSYGFGLSSKNWNGLIQALCRSSNLDHQVIAFELFEKFLLPNAPSWDVIRRGKWVKPSMERPAHIWDKIHGKRDDRKDRKTLEKINPSMLMPSYYTMVHLAIVWLKASRSSFQGDHVTRKRLDQQTPGTVKLVLQTPYLGDRVQGVLLRGRQVVGDPVRRPRGPTSDSAYLAGVQGSQRLVDQLDPDMLAMLEQKADSNSPSVGQPNLALAEAISGEITKSAIIHPSKGRFESKTERQARIAAAKRRKLTLLRNIVQQIREDSQNPAPLIGTITRGLLPYGSQAIPARSSRTGSVFGQQHLGTFAKIQRVLRNVRKQVLHEPSAQLATNQTSSVRTDSLTRRQGVVIRPPSISSGHLVARPRRQTKSRSILRRQRLRAERRAKWDNKAQYHMLRRSRRLAMVYRLRFKSMKSRASTKAVPSKTLLKQLGQYAFMARKAAKGRWRGNRKIAVSTHGEQT